MTSPSITRILVAKGTRAFADGFVSLLLPAYLLSLGHSPVEVGLIATATLLGSGIMTLLVGMNAWRYHFRTLLLGAAALMAATGAGFVLLTDFWPLLLVAFVGTLNPSSGDVSVFLPLEHALMSRLVADRDRTAVFARYSLAGALMGAAGSLAVVLPDVLSANTGLSSRAALQAMFVLYALVGVVTALIYRGLPAEIEAKEAAPPQPLDRSRHHVYRLAALFSLDAFGGGLVVQSMLALWLWQRFGLSFAETGTLFFCLGLLAAISYLLAVRIASRFGLVNTMVFTHLPANVCLVAVPFMDSFAPVLALLVIRALLSQMDVPTRSSFVMAIVPPAERAAAASVTSVPRSLASAAGPALAGYLLTVSPFGWPLVLGGGVKIVYDLLLLGMFGGVKPPEEVAKMSDQNGAPASAGEGELGERSRN